MKLVKCIFLIILYFTFSKVYLTIFKLLHSIINYFEFSEQYNQIFLTLFTAVYSEKFNNRTFDRHRLQSKNCLPYLDQLWLAISTARRSFWLVTIFKNIRSSGNNISDNADSCSRAVTNWLFELTALCWRLKNED